MATASNLYIDQGATFSAIISVRGSDGNPLDLTNFTVKSQMRKSYGSTTAYSFTATVYDALSGKIQLSLAADASSAIKPGRYLYDVEISAAMGGIKARVAEGLVILTPEITQI
jgi:hypothetical protein